MEWGEWGGGESGEVGRVVRWGEGWGGGRWMWWGD